MKFGGGLFALPGALPRAFFTFSGPGFPVFGPALFPDTPESRSLGGPPSRKGRRPQPRVEQRPGGHSRLSFWPQQEHSRSRTGQQGHSRGTAGAQQGHSGAQRGHEPPGKASSCESAGSASESVLLSVEYLGGRSRVQAGGSCGSLGAGGS